MGLTSTTEIAYLAPSVAAWTLLWLAALFDAVRHRQTKRRGYQLQRGLVVCLFAYVVQDVLLLSSSILNRRNASASDKVWKAYLVFGDLANSIFMLLLLLISAGYCITRDNLGPYASKVLATPAIYFVTQSLVDIVTDVYGTRNGELDPSDFSAWTLFVLYIAQVVSLMAFMLALVFIFEIVQREVESITKPREGIIGARDATSSLNAAERGRDGQGHGHRVDLPPEATENGEPLSDVYAEVTGMASKPKMPSSASSYGGKFAVTLAAVFESREVRMPARLCRPTGEDHDAPKTVEDRIQHRTKVQLMRQFSWAAAICVGCYIAALIVPIFYYSGPGEEATADRVVYILWDCVQWLFLAGLCFIFRVRDTNPYLLLDEDAGGLDTDFGSGEVHTELGVFSSASDKALENTEGVNRNFSIGGEDDDDEEVSRGRARLMSRHAEKSNID